jgi:hypothetical protein
VPDKENQSIVISLRLEPGHAEAFRTEAARRNMRLNDLFVEIFEKYMKQPAPPPIVKKRTHK